MNIALIFQFLWYSVGSLATYLASWFSKTKTKKKIGAKGLPTPCFDYFLILISQGVRLIVRKKVYQSVKEFVTRKSNSDSKSAKHVKVQTRTKKKKEKNTTMPCALKKDTFLFFYWQNSWPLGWLCFKTVSSVRWN